MTALISQPALNLREELAKRELNSRFTDAQIDEALAVARSGGQSSWHYDQGTNTVLDSTNLSSITDQATGTYQANYINPYVSTAVQKAMGMAMESGVRQMFIAGPDVPTTADGDFFTKNDSGTSYDCQSSAGMWGDLA